MEKLKNDKFNAYLSRDLATIDVEVPLVLSNGYELNQINQAALSESLQKLELSTLLRQVDIFNSAFSKGGFNKNNAEKQKGKESKVSASNDLEEIEHEIPKIKVTIVNDFKLLNQLVKKLEITKEIVALDTETNSLNPVSYTHLTLPTICSV